MLSGWVRVKIILLDTIFLDVVAYVDWSGSIFLVSINGCSEHSCFSMQ
jgi:hypothetical protein